MPQQRAEVTGETPGGRAIMDRGCMSNYDPETALEELREDAILPHPVRLRDMILRAKPDAEHALELNRKFQEYLRLFGEAQTSAGEVLEQLVRSAG